MEVLNSDKTLNHQISYLQERSRNSLKTLISAVSSRQSLALKVSHFLKVSADATAINNAENYPLVKR